QLTTDYQNFLLRETKKQQKTSLLIYKINQIINLLNHLSNLDSPYLQVVQKGENFIQIKDGNFCSMQQNNNITNLRQTIKILIELIVKTFKNQKEKLKSKYAGILKRVQQLSAYNKQQLNCQTLLKMVNCNFIKKQNLSQRRTNLLAYLKNHYFKYFIDQIKDILNQQLFNSNAIKQIFSFKPLQLNSRGASNCVFFDASKESISKQLRETNLSQRIVQQSQRLIFTLDLKDLPYQNQYSNISPKRQLKAAYLKWLSKLQKLSPTQNNKLKNKYRKKQNVKIDKQIQQINQESDEQTTNHFQINNQNLIENNQIEEQKQQFDQNLLIIDQLCDKYRDLIQINNQIEIDDNYFQITIEENNQDNYQFRQDVVDKLYDTNSYFEEEKTKSGSFTINDSYKTTITLVIKELRQQQIIGIVYQSLLNCIQNQVLENKNANLGYFLNIYNFLLLKNIATFKFYLNILATNPTGKCIIVRFGQVSQYVPELPHTLKKFKNITKFDLDLDNTGIGANQIKTIAKVLGNYKLLNTLNLSFASEEKKYNKIIKILVKNLKECQQITELSLCFSSNKIGDDKEVEKSIKSALDKPVFLDEFNLNLERQKETVNKNQNQPKENFAINWELLIMKDYINKLNREKVSSLKIEFR
ncbi:hypothetical protein ABPG72_014032, partial [Tetrahymena utriculariae]